MQAARKGGQINLFDYMQKTKEKKKEGGVGKNGEKTK